MRQRFEEHDSFILALTHSFLEGVTGLSRWMICLLCGISKEKVAIRHAEIFLVTTTLVLILLIVSAHYFFFLGWVIVLLGNLRIVQIVSLNLSTLIFDYSPVSDVSESLKRARWHFVAIGFSFLDTLLVFGFMYQFFDRLYGILNQHSSSFFDYLYYALITIASIGYGDIHPVTTLGRLLAMYEAVVALFFLVFFVSGALSRLQRH